MKVAVTGSAGFIGKHLCAALREAGHEVAEIDIANGMDVRHIEDIHGAFKGCQAVFHLAALNQSTAAFYTHPEAVAEVGARGILNVITEAGYAGVSDLIVASSSEVLGEHPPIPTPESAPITISDPTNPRWSYAASKAFSEVVALSAKGFAKTQVFRPFNVYGPGQGRGHVIPDLIHQRRHGGGTITLQGSPKNTRSFLHVADAVSGIIAMWRRGDSGVFHLGNPEEITIGELADMIAPKMPQVWVEAPAGSPPRRCPDISKMRRLGWVPTIGIHRGVGKIIAAVTGNEARWRRAHEASPSR